MMLAIQMVVMMVMIINTYEVFTVSHLLLNTNYLCSNNPVKDIILIPILMIRKKEAQRSQVT